ncbi:hypothetical protein LF41_2432 [Lysobacter dokdonensis DS-58]|uniref:Scaffolding protein n=1 Tax=Lysobacter dokdonensis DS-58 TaxID=1300345 RepID=A0A0A2WNQ3_9GAMM|nr:hypothetical protein [Lysobacter dokdonensis]KGQ19925.1 hypothetical protein LF41_2432 [Lysobacter dokdonensis DS-58]
MSDAIDLSAPEVQDAIRAAVEKATEGLVTKNRELLAEVKEARKGREVKPEDVEKLESTIDTLKEQLSEATKSAKQSTKDAEAARKELENERTQTNRLLVDNGLTDALVKAGVTNPVHQKAAKALLREGVSLDPDKALKVGEKALGDYITEWAGGDEGKHFVAAPQAQGGGSQGGRSKPETKPKGDSGGDKDARLARAQELLAQHEE